MRVRRHRAHANPFSLQAGPGALSPPQVTWARQAPIALDIGCGGGAFTEAVADAHPEWNVLGLEIRPHLVAQVNARMCAAGLTNGRGVLGNANMHLDALLAPDSVVFCAINFPDPWYKKRHHKRRVVSAAWLRLLSKVLRDGAQLHAMTDYAPLAASICQSLRECEGLFGLSGQVPFAPQSTTGITSERERKHMQRGAPIWRLQATYHAPRPAPVR